MNKEKRRISKPQISEKSVNDSRVLEKLLKRFGDSIVENEPLAQHTSFNIGGPAEFFLNAETPDQLLDGVRLARELKIEYFILGGGSNILVGDNGIPGLVIKNCCCACDVEDDVISAQSGLALDKLVDISCDNSLSGLEFAAGIWGTVGGAVCGNAGAFGGSISDVLKSAVVRSNDGAIDCVDKDYFEFQYRHSNIKISSELILSAAFKLRKGNKADIAMKIEEHRNKRSVKHPISLPSAGSFFKNFKNPVVKGKEAAAGWYLEQVGAKDLKVGDAGVFEKHANIFVNYGNASAGDVLTLASELKNRVLDKFNMDLYMEVRPVGDFEQFGELLDNLEYKNLKRRSL